MFKHDKTCTIRALCDNCGHEQMIELPVSREIIDFVRAEDYKDTTPSGYQRLNGSDYHILNCSFCHLAALKVLWFKNDEALVHEEVPSA